MPGISTDPLSRPRILWVTEERPDRNLGGGSIRQSHLFEALARRYRTDLLMVGELGDERVRACAAELIELPDIRAPWTTHPVGRRLLEAALIFGYPYPSAAYPAAPARRALARKLRQIAGRYALICVEHEALAPLRGVPRERSLITFHHLFSGMARQQATLDPGARQRLYRRVDVQKAKRLERRALRRFRLAVTCSEDDAAVLRRLSSGSPAAIEVVPNGVELAQFRATPVPGTQGVLFPASLGYFPNVDGALWFCAEVWPRVRKARPSATLKLVGRSPVPEVKALGGREGVSVEADVPSMASYYEQARVIVVPLRTGTGTRLKALEAMASGRPMVGTKIGLEGIGIAGGTEALIADDPAQMAAAIVDVLDDDALATRLAAAGRKHVEERFGWDRVATGFVELIAGLVDPAPGSATS